MSEKTGPLGALRREAMSMLRSSDTFKLVTTEGATRLSQRARERKHFISDRLGPLADVEINDLPERREFDAVLRLAEIEAEAQEKLAAWLKLLAGGDA